MGWQRHGLACALAMCAGCSSGAKPNGSALSGQGTFSGSGDVGSSGEATSVGTSESSSGGVASTSTSGGSSSSGASGSSSSSSTGSVDIGPVGFDDDPGWVSYNLPFDGNDYGWRSSMLAGGAAGEIGGHFQRPSQMSYYAHVDLAIDTAGPIAAAGRMNVVDVEGDYNYNTFIGHFLIANPDGGRLGLELLEPGDGEARVRLVHGADSFDVFDIQDLGLDRDWSYSFDPDVGDYGRIDVTLEGQDMISYDLTAEDRTSIASLDAFGLLTRYSDSAGDYPGRLEAYFDDIDYTR